MSEELKPAFKKVVNINSEIRGGYSPSQAQSWLKGVLVFHASEFEDAVNTGERLLREAYAEIDRLTAWKAHAMAWQNWENTTITAQALRDLGVME